MWVIFIELSSSSQILSLDLLSLLLFLSKEFFISYQTFFIVFFFYYFYSLHLSTEFSICSHTVQINFRNAMKYKQSRSEFFLPSGMVESSLGAESVYESSLLQKTTRITTQRISTRVTESQNSKRSQMSLRPVIFKLGHEQLWGAFQK